MTHRFSELERVPLRDHGTSDRVDAVWRRLERRLSRPARPRAQGAFLRAAGFVLVFGGGVFVGSRWSKPAAAPTLSAERPPVIEPVANPERPGAAPVRAPTPAPSVKHAPRSRVTPAPSARAVLSPVLPPAPATEASSTSAAPPVWERLAETGDFEAARAALEAHGGFEDAIAAASASQLMTLVDIARASGSKERAVLALRRVVEAFPDAPEAPDAAWTLGNMLEQSGDELGAAEAFALYRRLSPSGDFAQDALAHEIDAAFARSDLELSARLVAQYENEFPNGPRLGEFRAELERRTLKATASASGKPDAREPDGDEVDAPDEPTTPASDSDSDSGE